MRLLWLVRLLRGWMQMTLRVFKYWKTVRQLLFTERVQCRVWLLLLLSRVRRVQVGWVTRVSLLCGWSRLTVTLTWWILKTKWGFIKKCVIKVIWTLPACIVLPIVVCMGKCISWITGMTKPTECMVLLRLLKLRMLICAKPNIEIPIGSTCFSVMPLWWITPSVMLPVRRNPLLMSQ